MDQRLARDARALESTSIQYCGRRLIAGGFDGEYDRAGRSAFVPVALTTVRQGSAVAKLLEGARRSSTARQGSLLRRLGLSAALSINHDALHRIDCSIQLRIALAIDKFLIVGRQSAFLPSQEKRLLLIQRQRRLDIGRDSILMNHLTARGVVFR